MNFIDQLADKLSILRGDIDNSEVAYINAPVEDLSGFAKTVLKGNGLAGDIQEADRFHITLAIFPKFPESAIGDLLQLSLPIQFNVTATKLGTFPKAPSKPLIMYVDPDPALVRLQADIYNLGLKLGLQLPDYDHFKASLWQPHITLAMDVKGMPDEFAPINPVKVGIDRFVVQREGYDQVVEINLPGTLGDRPFITVRSVVQRAVQVEEAVERIAPRTLEVSRKEFMAMLRGEVVVHGPTRRVLTFDDGPFAIRHGKHVGQEGRKGEKGGTEPGFTHEDGVGNGIEEEQETREFAEDEQEEAHEWALETFVSENPLDDDSIESLIDYKNYDAYEMLNKALRSDDETVFENKQRLADIRESIDKAMDASVVPENLIVYRGMSSERVERLAEKDQQFTDLAYVSTSLTPFDTSTFASEKELPTILEIHIPKGTKGIYMENFNEIVPNEEEVLLDRGLKFEFVSNKPRELYQVGGLLGSANVWEVRVIGK